MIHRISFVMKNIIAAVATFTLLAFSAHAGDNMHPHVRLKTSFGDIVLELDREKAPKSVENFLAYVSSGFYDGTIFHRVIDGFMVQGGGFTQDFKQKPTNPTIDNEADNGLKNNRGTVAMARIDGRAEQREDQCARKDLRRGVDPHAPEASNPT